MYCHSHSQVGTGRPSKKWDDCSHRNKRRRVSELKQSRQTLELATAAFTRGYDSLGNQDLSETIKHKIMNPRNSYTPKMPVKMSSDTALVLKVQCSVPVVAKCSLAT